MSNISKTEMKMECIHEKSSFLRNRITNRYQFKVTRTLEWQDTLLDIQGTSRTRHPAYLVQINSERYWCLVITEIYTFNLLRTCHYCKMYYSNYWPQTTHSVMNCTGMHPALLCQLSRSNWTSEIRHLSRMACSQFRQSKSHIQKTIFHSKY